MTDGRCVLYFGSAGRLANVQAAQRSDTALTHACGTTAWSTKDSVTEHTETFYCSRIKAVPQQRQRIRQMGSAHSLNIVNLQLVWGAFCLRPAARQGTSPSRRNRFASHLLHRSTNNALCLLRRDPCVLVAARYVMTGRRCTAGWCTPAAVRGFPA